jgi:hypothetical protein
MQARDEARYWEALERRLDEGIVEDREVILRLPSLGLDLLGLNVHTFTTSSMDHLDDVDEVQTVEADAEDALPPDGLLTAPDADDTEESGGDAPYADGTPSHH